jgi:hypothetical protein
VGDGCAIAVAARVLLMLVLMSSSTVFRCQRQLEKLGDDGAALHLNQFGQERSIRSVRGGPAR